MSRSFLVPEVIQTSLMDCGPAALAAALRGFGIDADYDELRERCQTHVDGTSIDALAALGRERGLECREVLAARDTLLLPELAALPAIVLTRLPGGLLHFVLVWRVVGPLVQILDPSGGRAWVSKRTLLARICDVALPLSAARFHRWMGSARGVAVLRARMDELGVPRERGRELVARAESEPSGRGWATLDAGIRMVAAMKGAGAVSRGEEASALLGSVTASGAEIPKKFWWATPSPRAPGMLTLEGTVVVQLSRKGTSDVRRAPSVSQKPPPPEPLALVLRTLLASGAQPIGWAALALAATAVVSLLDVLLLRGVLDAHRMLSLGVQRVAGLVALLTFAGIALGLELLATRLVQALGLALEVRLRAALLAKLPRLTDAYLESRPTSDMASRGHSLHALREAPVLVARGVRAGLALASATACVAWLSPANAALAVVSSALALALPWALRRLPSETSVRLRTQATTLDRFYLDALRGVVPIRVHGAERAVAREHEGLLVEWARSGRALAKETEATSALQASIGTALAVLIVARFASEEAALASLALLAFWVLRIPAAGQEVALALAGWREMRVTLTRLLSPLHASEVPVPDDSTRAPVSRAVAIELAGVTAVAGGHEVLRGVDLSVAAGEHVAIVGASGAGKSSLFGLLQGFLPIANGTALVDGEALDLAAIARLRPRTAWVDPAVFLWNRSLLANVTYGNEGGAAVASALRGADLLDVLEHLPEGMRAELGEGGARVSGGQGQRVRLARAWLRDDAGLVLLDEPFRGLERDRRRALLARAREHFAGATMLLVSHDVADTTELDRVVVMDGGRVVEDGAPRELLARPDSRYRALLEADREQRATLWSSSRWSRRWVERGTLSASGGER